MARRLLVEAKNCPALISRTSQAPAVFGTEPREHETRARAPFPPMALLSEPALDVRRYLEDLVSVAVSAAQQAEDVASQASEAYRRVRRGMFAVAGFGALGLLVGIAGFAASRGANIRLSEVRAQIGAVESAQRQTQGQLATIKSMQSDRLAGVRSVGLTGAGTTSPMADRQPAPTETLPAFQPPTRHSEPWPDSRPPASRVALVHSRPVVVPGFIANIERNLRAMFH